MSDIEIKLKVPEELVARAEAAGVKIEQQADEFIALVEKEIRRREAGKELLQIAEQLRALPPEDKPSIEEIDEAIEKARQELYEERKASGQA